MSAGKEKSKASKVRRSEVYKNHRAQLLLSRFVSGELGRLDPVYDPKYGYRYPVVEKIVGEPSSAAEFLGHLFEAGVLERELYDMIVYCPSCSSVSVSIHYCCPYCKSFNVKKSSLIEHIPCGYIDTEDRFLAEDKLVCPKCGKELTKPDVDHRKAGVWCTCNDCGKSFDIPVPSHFCRDCRENFTFEDSLCKEVYSYSLSEDVMREAALGRILVAPIREFLQERGFEVDCPGFLKGKSGATHMFDVTASLRGMAVIDLATATDDIVSEESVIAMFAKVYDVAPKKACLIAIPKMSENGKRLADLYKIELIEAKDQNEAIKALEDCIKGLG